MLRYYIIIVFYCRVNCIFLRYVKIFFAGTRRMNGLVISNDQALLNEVDTKPKNTRLSKYLGCLSCSRNRQGLTNNLNNLFVFPEHEYDIQIGKLALVFCNYNLKKIKFTS